MVYVLLADGFEEVEALTPIDLLRRSAVEVCTIGIGGSHIVGARGVTVVADAEEKEIRPDQIEMLILPGGYPGYENLGKSEFVHTLLQKAIQNEHCYIAAICGAPSLLGHIGALQGKTATCYPGMEKELIGAKCSESAVCVDGRMITSRSAATAMEFSLTLVEILKGKQQREILEKQIVFGSVK